MFFIATPLSYSYLYTVLMWVYQALSSYLYASLLLPTVCVFVFVTMYREAPGKRDAWLETMESIRIRVFVTVRKEERGRRNSNSLSGKMCFSVTMAFSVHNLSHKALWGMCLWQGTKSIMTYCWTCLYIVSHVYVLILPQPWERTNTQWDCAKKKRGDCCLADHRSV